MKTILIVDDQLLYLKSLEMALKKKYKVYTALSYDQAREILQKDIDIALIDVRLDEDNDRNIDGLKILEWIQKSKPQTSVLMMSAYREFSYAEQVLNLGAQHFFRKPIDVENLMAVLKEKT